MLQQKLFMSAIAYVFIPTSIAIKLIVPAQAQAVKSTKSPQLTTNKSTIIAQDPQPNEDRFLQPDNNPNPTDLDSEEIIVPTPSDETPPMQIPEPNPPIVIPVRQIEVVGNTVFTAEDFAPIIEPLEGREVTLSQLQAAARDITRLYVESGYINSRAVVAPQDIVDGVVQIQVIEGSLGEIEIENNDRLNDSYIRSRINQGVDTPLNVNDLEDRLRLLQSDVLIEDIDASLQPGTRVGESNLVIVVDEANPFILGVFSDNYNPPPTGSERIGAYIGYQNITGFGDRFVFTYDRSVQGGHEAYDLSYSIPVNAKDGTIGLRAIFEDNEIIDDDFDEFFNIRGESQLYEVSFRQPIIRSFREEFALSIGFSHQYSRDFINEFGFPFFIGAEEDGTSRTSVIKFGQDYTTRDPNGVWALRSQFNLGIDALDATINEGDAPDGEFFSWLAQAQRLQRLDDDQLLIVTGEIQLTPDSLLPSQQFVIGGGLSVRGYRQNVRFADNGFRFSVEDRITIERDSEENPTFQLAPFVDLGYVWNSDDNPNPEADENFIVGIGTGIILQPTEDLTIRVDYGIPLVDLDDVGDNAQDEGVYFSVNYRLP